MPRETAVLTARVVWEDDKFIARVLELPLQGAGESVQEAQDELINSLRSWIELQDGASSLERSMAEAGIPDVAEETELQLEFLG